jgi:hypothetical protein
MFLYESRKPNLKECFFGINFCRRNLLIFCRFLLFFISQTWNVYSSFDKNQEAGAKLIKEKFLILMSTALMHFMSEIFFSSIVVDSAGDKRTKNKNKKRE